MEDINSCTARKLVKLAGLSQALANRIVAYRKQVVAVQCLNEILKINGVTRAIFKTIKSNFCVKQQTTRPRRVTRSTPEASNEDILVVSSATSRKKQKQNQIKLQTKAVSLRPTAESQVSHPHDVFPVNNMPVITRIPDPKETETQAMSSPGQLTMYSPVKLTASPSGSKLTTVYRRLPTMSVCQKSVSQSKGRDRISGKVSCVYTGRESERQGDNVDISTQTIPPTSSKTRRNEDLNTYLSQTAEDKRVSIEKWLQMVETPQSSPLKTCTYHSMRETDGHSLGKKTSMTNLTKHTPKQQTASTSAARAVEPVLFRTDGRMDNPVDTPQATHRSQRNPRCVEVDGPSRKSPHGNNKRHQERSSRKTGRHHDRRDKRNDEHVPRSKEKTRRHLHARSRSISRGAEQSKDLVAHSGGRRGRDTHRRSRVRYRSRSRSRGGKQSTEWVAERIEKRGRGARRHSHVRSRSKSKGVNRDSKRSTEGQKRDERSSSSPVRSVSSVERSKSASRQSRCSVM